MYFIINTLLYNNDNVNVGALYFCVMKVNFESDSEQFLFN